MDILSQIFAGFGARNIHRHSSIAHAAEFMSSNEVDLIVANDKIGHENGHDFVHWVRRRVGDPNAFAPAILISGHTKRSMVVQTRDCGANFLIAKPVSPQVVLERVMWVAREKRPYLQAGEYIGPDRRHMEPTEKENQRRRRDDQEAAASVDALDLKQASV